MAKSELKDLLLKERQEVLLIIQEAQGRLDAIDKLIGVKATAKTNSKPEKKEKREVKPDGISKADYTWKAYILVVLKAIGGRGKTADLIAYAIKANPNMSDTTVSNSISGWLSNLALSNEVGVEKGVKSEGYTYFLLDKKNNTKSLFGEAA